MDQWPLALTIGEPAGVGPELVARIATDVWSRPLVAVGDGGSLRRAAAAQRLPLRLHAVPAGPLPALPAGEIYLHDVPAAVPATPGQLDVRNAPAVLAMI
ncbi:MAG: 4-hydroxythreonine-4-phosphate dehydrogenase PdxA, partial [Xanthomonadales bacterium]|nr:4-hydroxythreonine-4-phosphate dehydrogenase PdxA [Xanthomonadales bacterium]